MLPNKKYFHISALVSENYLYEIMEYLKQKKAYNVEVVTFIHEEEQPKRIHRDMTEIKEKIVKYLTEHGPTNAIAILKATGQGKDFTLLNRMTRTKQIKKVKKGVYRV